MNFYNNLSTEYTEIGIAVADYTYGGKVKITIPSLLPMAESDKVIYDSSYNDYDNILNQNKNEVDLGKVNTANYIIIPVPLELCPKCYGLEKGLEKNIKAICKTSDSHTHEIEITYDRCKHQGSKGDKFLIQFIGGNVQNPMIYRRLDE